VESLPGGIAPTIRRIDDSFTVDISLKVKVPEAMVTLEHFTTANPAITTALPVLGEILAQAKVSSYYHALYSLKVRSLQTDVSNLNTVLSRHNFFDCGTILEYTHPVSQRKALILQGDMDVVADGSDSDRYLEVDGTSTYYQPFTSYRWRKRTAVPSQFLVEKNARIAETRAALATPGLTPEKAAELRKTISTTELQITDLKTFSFLIAKADPFIVLPGFMIRNKTLPFCPRIGDYAAVIFGNKIYPAIFGDVGPSVKVGEASLRLSRSINAAATAYRRPTNRLDVSYIVFPQSADESAPPDYEKWRTRCIELLAEIGATNVTVERWENILPPPPTPTPTPTPDPGVPLPAPRGLEATPPATSPPTPSPLPTPS